MGFWNGQNSKLLTQEKTLKKTSPISVNESSTGDLYKSGNTKKAAWQQTKPSKQDKNCILCSITTDSYFCVSVVIKRLD